MVTRYGELELVKGVDGVLKQGQVRVYRTPIGGEWRYHLGFPVKMIRGLEVTLRASLAWGSPWVVRDGYAIFSTEIVGTKYPEEAIGQRVRRMVRWYRRAIGIDTGRGNG